MVAKPQIVLDMANKCIVLQPDFLPSKTNEEEANDDIISEIS